MHRGSPVVGHLGVILKHLGGILKHVEDNEAMGIINMLKMSASLQRGAHLGSDLGASWGHLWAPGGHLGAILGPSCGSPVVHLWFTCGAPVVHLWFTGEPQVNHR